MGLTSQRRPIGIDMTMQELLLGDLRSRFDKEIPDFSREELMCLLDHDMPMRSNSLPTPA